MSIQSTEYLESERHKLAYRGDFVARPFDAVRELGLPMISQTPTRLPVVWKLQLKAGMALVYLLSEFETTVPSESIMADRDEILLWNARGPNEIAEFIEGWLGEGSLTNTGNEVPGLTRSKPHPEIPF